MDRRHLCRAGEGRTYCYGSGSSTAGVWAPPIRQQVTRTPVPPAPRSSAPSSSTRTISTTTASTRPCLPSLDPAWMRRSGAPRRTSVALVDRRALAGRAMGPVRRADWSGLFVLLRAVDWDGLASAPVTRQVDTFDFTVVGLLPAAWLGLGVCDDNHGPAGEAQKHWRRLLKWLLILLWCWSYWRWRRDRLMDPDPDGQPRPDQAGL